MTPAVRRPDHAAAPDEPSGHADDLLFFTGLKEKPLISSHLDIGKYRGMIGRVERVLIGHNDIFFSDSSYLRADVIY